jgi:nicotinamidase-related amidase
MQNDFCHHSGNLVVPNHELVVAENVALLTHFSFDRVTCTLDTHVEDYLKTREGQHLPIEHCQENTFGHKLVQPVYNALYNQNMVNFIEKETFAPAYQNFFNNFNTLSWDDNIFICGVCTDICVISTALQLRTLYPENEIYLIEPCCAGTTGEKHNHAVNVMESCQINIIHNFAKLSNIISNN